MDIYNLVSFIGIFILMFIAWLLSPDKKNINVRVIVWGIILQFTFAVFIFIIPIGSDVFLFVNDIVVKILDSAGEGAKFLFGRLALAPGTTNEAGESSLGFFLAFQALPTVIFFAALMSLLYYMNIMQHIIKAFSYVFTKLMGISGAESLSSASNIFVGIESAFTIRPYLKDMTRSEYCTILTACMATVSSNVLAIYVFTLQGQFPAIAGHLVSASVLSAPAALVMSKLILPESGTPRTLGESVQPFYEKEENLFVSIINGAQSGVRLIVGIAALLIAILGLVALANLIIGGAGVQINNLTGMNLNWTLEEIFGYLFYPFTLIIGIPVPDALTVSKIIGERVIVTEVVSYQHLAASMEKGILEDSRSVVVTTYALCGFAHVASMAIFVGGISAIVPERRTDIAGVGFRALAAATLTCLMTACVAGVFFTGDSILMGN